MNWIEDLIDAAKEAETPTEWLYWSGIATVSAIVAPNVWMNCGGVYNLSPNVFIMLIGESGLGKGLPIAVSKKLVKMVDSTRVISGANTIASILQTLANTFGDQKTGTPKFKDSRAYIISGEFANLLQEDKRALPTLTELYDTHYSEDWSSSTKHSGVDKLDKVNITLFGGSTPEHFANVVPESDVKGGFVGRILTVYQEKRSKTNPLDDTEATNQFPYERLAEHLKTIALVRGPFHWGSPEVRQYWRDWYHPIREKEIHDPTGAVNRLPDNVRKVAMCLALAKRVELAIQLEDLEEAIDKCMALTIDSKRLTGGKGKSATGEGTHLVIRTLHQAKDHQVLKGKLLELHYGTFDIYELDRIIATLEGAGVIESQMVAGGKILLKMMPDKVEMIKKFMER